jgi:AraC family L-rhamnose operon transcriptional activator RhaR/AraC family L-rhamnose operon regulatory protein RhaS
MSGRGLRRHFKALLGRSPGDYVLHLRIEEAKRLLEAGRLGITEAGLECGFSDGNYFSRVFKAQTGLTPRQWRRRGASK